MKLEKIQEMWNDDAKIDITNLDHEAISIPYLHAKYYRVYTSEKLAFIKLKSDLKILKLEKFEFYTQGPTKETQAKGWIMPARGMILKSDVQTYLDADKDIIDLTLKIAIQEEKVDFLDSIIKSFTNRGYNIKAAIDYIKFKNGT